MTIRAVDKQTDRGLLMTDAVYFADELAKRLERIAVIDTGRHRTAWHQCELMVRRVRQLTWTRLHRHQRAQRRAAA